MKYHLLVLVVTVLLASSLTVGASEALFDPAYYDSLEVPFFYESVVNYSKWDFAYDFDGFEYSPDDVNYTISITKNLWIGALELDVGELLEEDEAFIRNNISLSYSLELLSDNHTNVSADFKISHTFHERGCCSGTFYTTLYNGPITVSDVIDGTVTFSLQRSSYDFENKSRVPSLTYNALNYDHNLSYYSMLLLQFSLPQGTTWDQELSAAVILSGRHNPEFFDLMVERSNYTPPTPINPYVWILVLVPVLVIGFYLAIRRFSNTNQ